MSDNGTQKLIIKCLDEVRELRADLKKENHVDMKEKYEELKKQYDDLKRDYDKETSQFPFHIGPYGVLIPHHIKRYVDEDGINTVTIHKNGLISFTEMGIEPPFTKEQWLKEYAYHDDYLNVWIYKRK